MRATLALSLVCHAVAITAMQRVFPIAWFNKPLRTYQVELIRPPVESIEEEDFRNARLGKEETEDGTPPEIAEETISLNTKDERYRSYAKVIKEKLSRHWVYPRQAIENLMEGQLFLVFTLNRGGQLQEIIILQGSGYEILDEETLRTIKAAAPFPPFPGSLKVKRLHIRASFDYHLTKAE
jgi:protein TonB